MYRCILVYNGKNQVENLFSVLVWTWLDGYYLISIKNSCIHVTYPPPRMVHNTSASLFCRLYDEKYGHSLLCKQQTLRNRSRREPTCSGWCRSRSRTVDAASAPTLWMKNSCELRQFLSTLSYILYRKCCFSTENYKVAGYWDCNILFLFCFIFYSLK